MSLLTLTTSPEDEGVRVALEGELDLSSALLFDEEMRRIETEAAPATVLLDLSALKFMDSTGLRLILSANHRAIKRGHRLAILLGSEAIKRIFRLTGVVERLDIIDEHPAPVRPLSAA